MLLTPDRDARLSLGRRRALKSLGGIALIGLARKSLAGVGAIGRATGSIGNGTSPQGLPRLSGAAFSYLGNFIVANVNLPDGTGWPGASSVAVDTDTASGTYPDGQLFIGTNGNVSWNTSHGLGKVAIPSRSNIALGVVAGNAVTATLVISPIVIPWTAGGGAAQGGQYKQQGCLVYNGRLIYQQAIFYDSANYTTATHGYATLDLSSVNACVATSPNFANMRFVNSYMGLIPSQWQSLFGGPALAGSGTQSIQSVAPTGVTAYVFDPAKVGMGSVPMTCALAYDFVSGNAWSHALGASQPANGWESWDLNGTASVTNGSTTLTVGGSPSGIITGPVGTGVQIASGSESTNTTAGIPVGATLLSQLSGTTGGAGTYQMSAAATAIVTNGYACLGTADNGFCREDDNYSGVIFPSGTRTVAFLGQHGTGPLAYKNPNDTASPDRAGGYGCTTYARRMLMYDANDLLAVIQGSKNPYAPLPYTTVDLVGPAGCGMDAAPSYSVGLSSVYYDDAPLNGNPPRIYMIDYADGARVHVWEVDKTKVM